MKLRNIIRVAGFASVLMAPSIVFCADGTLVVSKGDGTAKLVVEEVSGTVATRTLLDLVNNGSPQLRFKNTQDAGEWLFAMLGNKFRIKRENSGDGEFLIAPNGRLEANAGGVNLMTLVPNGNLQIAGTLAENSDVAVKTAIQEVDAHAILGKVSDLSVSEWSYKASPQSRHLGPMAQDFHRAFGLGDDEKSISPRDLAAIALVAIQAQQQLIESQNRKIENLVVANHEKAEHISDLEVRLKALEITGQK